MKSKKSPNTPLFQEIEQYIQANFELPQPEIKNFFDDGEFAKPSPKASKVIRGILDAVLQMTEKTFAEKLMSLIQKRGCKAADIYIKAGITKQHFSKIKNHSDYQPTKETALAFAIALHLSLEETKDLIGRAGFTLSKSSKRDLIVEYFIERKIYDVDAINENLYSRGFSTLTNRRNSKD